MKAVTTMVLITVIAGIVLASLHWQTQDAIESNTAQSEMERLEGLIGDDSLEELCERDIELIEVEIRGYGGPMVIVAARQNEEIIGVRAVRHTETPGFADVLEPDDWIGQFGVVPTDSIDAVTRATITTNSVLQAVEEALLDRGTVLNEC